MRQPCTQQLAGNEHIENGMIQRKTSSFSLFYTFFYIMYFFLSPRLSLSLIFFVKYILAMFYSN